MMDNLDFSEDTRFSAGNADFAMDAPIEMNGGLFILCESGDADLLLDNRVYHMKKGEEAVILTKKFFFVASRRDFSAKYFFICYDLLRTACSNFSSFFYNTVDECPVFRHNRSTLAISREYFRMILKTEAGTCNRYRDVMLSNLVRNLLLYIYDGIQSSGAGMKGTRVVKTRRQAIVDEFMDKVLRHCIHHRDVDYYASRLCISSRYLNSVTRELTGESPKQMIDAQTINELKTMLLFSDKTIEQIADTFHFPDQSSLGRYFKKATGFSPMEFRKSGLVYPSSL